MKQKIKYNTYLEDGPVAARGEVAHGELAASRSIMAVAKCMAEDSYIYRGTVFRGGWWYHPPLEIY